MSLSTNKRLNELKETLIGYEPKIAVGSGEQLISSNDTSLINELYRDDAVSEDRGVGELLHKMILPSTEANGEDISECGTVDTEGDVVSHIVFSSELKTSDKEFIFEIKTKVVSN